MLRNRLVQPGKKSEHAVVLFACAAVAAALLYLCSMSSPLYPLNTWCDANCMFTVGRVMKAGGVLYRDIYEQKGPLLYLIHMIAAYISESSFFGVYIMEILAVTATLFMAYKLIRLDTQKTSFAFGGAALFGAVLLASRVFVRGDSAEEFCMPLLLMAIYILHRHDAHARVPLGLREMMILGVLAGIVATIKFTLLALFLALCVVEGLCAWKRSGFMRLLAMAGAFLGGMMLPILPWIAYFAAHGALLDAYYAYIYNNVALYQGAGTSLDIVLWRLNWFFEDNLLCAIFIGIGIFRNLLEARKAPIRACAMLLGFVLMFSISFLTGQYFAYYAYPLCVFAVPAFGWMLNKVGKWFKRGAVFVPLCIVFATGFAWKTSHNAFLRGLPMEWTAQGMLAQHIEPGSSLLQYSFLDEGLYFASGILPEEKYFVELNINLPEMRESLDEALIEGRPDYVLISCRKLPEQFDRYELIATEYGYDDNNNWNIEYNLYRRKTE